MKRLLTRLLIAAMVLTIIIVPLHSTDKHSDYNSVTASLKKINKQNPNLVELVSIGKTSEKRDIWMVRLTNERVGDPEQKSGLFICSNIEADYLIGSEAVMAVIDRLLSGYSTNPDIKELLDNKTLYLVPRVNPDGAEYLLSNPIQEFAANLNSFDDDHDGFIDEDGPEDLNNDGFITQMRVKKPAGKYIIDPSDNRLLKKADPIKAETGVYTIYTEGLDNDKDGIYNEDGPGGPEINRNFPHAYPYHKKGSGAYMTSEPETKVLIDFLVGHPNIVATLTYSWDDNLVTPPKPEKKKPTTQAPASSPMQRFYMSRTAPNGVNNRDLSYFKEISEKYKKLTGFTKKPLGEKVISAGSFSQYGYYQYGVMALTTPFWQIPQAMIKPAKKEGSAVKKGKPASSEKNSPDQTILKWIETESIEKGFIAWQEYQHPDLGKVDIGGFNPRIQFTPKALSDSLVIKQTNFIIELAGLFPKLDIADLKVTSKGENVYFIEAVIRNTGYLPTELAHASYARSIKPIIARLEGKGFNLLAGQHHVFLKPISGSGSTDRVSWLVNGKPGTLLKLTINSNKAGSLARTIKLR